jgi:serine/threonine protein kinase
VCCESDRKETKYDGFYLVDHDDYLKNALFSEIQIMQLLKSENIVKILDVMESSNNYYIIQELCDSDLEKYMLKKGKIKEEEAVSILKQICSGFLTLTKEGIVHRYLFYHPATSNPRISSSAKASSRSVTSDSPRKTSQNA